MSAAGVVACGAFSGDSSDDPSSSSDAGSEGATIGDGLFVDDAGHEDSPGTTGTERSCPRPLGASCEIADCAIEVLYAPAPLGTAPFAIVTDPRSIFWVEQTKDDAGGDAYNGRARGRVLRLDRGSKTPTVLVDGQQNTTTLALDGGRLYWAALDGTSWELRSVKARCPSGSACAAAMTSVPMAAGVGEVRRIVHSNAGTLVVHGVNGVARIEVDGPVPEMLTVTPFGGNLGSIATTNDHVYLGTASSASIMRVSVRGGAPATPFFDAPAIDGGTVGVGTIATDCTRLFGFRRENSVYALYEAALGLPGPMTNIPLASATDLNAPIYDLVTDATHTWLALPNFGGVFAIDNRASRVVKRVGNSNVWSVAVDDLGVYWGDHDANTGGALIMLRKK